MLSEEKIIPILNKWTDILRIQHQWDIDICLLDTDDFQKTGDIKIDVTDKKAIILLNKRNPREENMEEVIVHELLHLKLYPLDQLTETLIDNHYDDKTAAYHVIYEQFMISLETTVEELTKCFLMEFGNNDLLSFGRVKEMKSFEELFGGLKNSE
ncbi:hypothetical protein JNUCC83_10795 [Vagococcus sp. JNUCC 83]